MQFSLNTGSNTTTQSIEWDVDDNRHDDNTTFYPKNGFITQQWLSQNNQAATYDATGNLIQLGIRRYSYNAQNQLTDASDNGALLGQYSYGPNGFRVKKVAGGKIAYFLYLPSGELLGEYETATGGYHVDAEHVYLRGMPIATLTGGVGSDVMPTTGTTSSANAQKIAQLQSKLATVQAQAALKEAQLQQQLTDEIAQAAQKKNDLQQQLDTLLADAAAQQASIQSDINTLLADTAAQVADLQNQINTVLADAATQTAVLQAALATATPKEATKIQKQLDNLATKTANQEGNLRDKLAQVQDKSATKEANLRDKLAAVTEKKAIQEANLRDKIAQAETNSAQKEQKLQASLAKVDANEARRVLAISDRIARLQAQGGSGSSVAAMDLGFVHTDAIGTPRKITRASDNSLLWSLSPDDAWGGNLPDASSTITYNLRYAGQFYDSETGLHNNGYRAYCPACGRYLQPDPVGLIGGMHRYNYANGDPLNNVDPLGLWVWGDPIDQRIVDASAGLGDGVSLGVTALIRQALGTNSAVDFSSGYYWGAYGAGFAVSLIGANLGAELKIGNNIRIAPWGNRTGNPNSELPHYHRRGQPDACGKTPPGQGIGRHRPWERKSTDDSFFDRF